MWKVVLYGHNGGRKTLAVFEKLWEAIDYRPRPEDIPFPGTVKIMKAS